MPSTHFIVFDIESTGLSTVRDRICSIAALDIESGRKYYAEVCPLEPVGYGAQKVHGLTMRRLQKKPPWQKVGRHFWSWLLSFQQPGDSLVLVGHNAVKFDIKMLASEIGRLDGLVKAKGRMFVVDTLPISREVISKTVLASKKQMKVYEHLFGEQPTGQHNALGDVEALARIAQHKIFRRRIESPKTAFALELGKQISWPHATTV
jgi:DNA polymerase III epsilon subunit-like protein